MKTWPIQPLKIFSKWIYKNKNKFKNKRLLDNGCGTGKVAQEFMENYPEVMGNKASPKYKIFKSIESMDLVSSKPYIRAGNMGNLPFQEAHFDLVLFSLSLMNTNFVSFIGEALRVLKQNGCLIISKIFDSPNV
jgi:ubiquinone/menaquinone biosynthesis C-methylase UbiE